MRTKTLLMFNGILITVAALTALLCPVEWVARNASLFTLGVALGYGIYTFFDGWYGT